MYFQYDPVQRLSILIVDPVSLLVDWSVNFFGWSFGRSVIKNGMLHFHAPIGALVNLLIEINIFDVWFLFILVIAGTAVLFNNLVLTIKNIN